MHISDGVLPIYVSVFGYVVSGIISLLLSIKIKLERIPKIATVTSALFIASLFHLNIGPSSIHLVLGGIGALILGPEVFLAFLVALFFQAVMFSEGGITSLGINVLTIGGGAFLTAIVFKPMLVKINNKFIVNLIYFLAGFLSVLLSAIFTSSVLLLADSSFLTIVKILFVSHLPLAIIEGVITLFVINFIVRVKPELINE